MQATLADLKKLVESNPAILWMLYTMEWNILIT